MAERITVSHDGVLVVPTNRSSRSSKATAPASTSGPRHASSSTPPPPSTAARSPGKRSWRGRRRSRRPASGCPRRRSTAFRDHLIGIKGPLTTPIGGGIRSLNVALRQILDLYVCLRPVRWFTGVPSPVLHPEKVDMVIFRENTEDVYAGLEVQAGTPEAERLAAFLRDEMGWEIRPHSGIGIKPISETRLQAPGPRRARVRTQAQSAPASRWSTRATSRSSPKGHSATGATSSSGTSSPTSPSAGTTVTGSRATSCSSRTPSPTSPFSRYSPGPRTSTSSPPPT